MLGRGLTKCQFSSFLCRFDTAKVIQIFETAKSSALKIIMAFAGWLISMKLILGFQKTESVGNIIQTGMKRCTG